MYTSTIDARYDTAVGNRAYAAKYRTMYQGVYEYDPRFRSALEQQSIELYHHAGIHVIEKQQSIELYHHAGIHVIETGAKVVFAAVLGSIPVPVL